MLPIDEEPHTIEDFVDRAVDKLMKADEEGKLNHDTAINVVLTFVEKVIPKILAKYEGQEYKEKEQSVARSLRVTIWSIMPWDRFMEYMSGKEMKAIDEMAKSIQDKGYVDLSPEAYNSLFKSPTEAPRDIYK